MITKKQINKLINSIAIKFNTKKIILFGSYAYGNPESGSDLDLCIIADLKNKRKIDLIRDIRREISSNFQIPIDILLYDNKDFNERSIHKNTLEYKILNSGKLFNE